MNAETKLQLIEAEQWQEELIEVLESFNGRPLFFYRVAEELDRLFPSDDREYDPFAGSGLPDFIVATEQPTDDQLRDTLKEYAGVKEKV